MGFRIWGLGFGIKGLGFRIWGLGLGIKGLGFRIWGLGFAVEWRISGSILRQCYFECVVI